MIVTPEHIGQLMMIGLAGPRLTREERLFLKIVQPAGVIFFKRNIESPRQLRALAQAVAAELRSQSPLLGIDQEGGRVARLNAPFTAFPGNDFLGRCCRATGKADLAEAQARAIAAELKSVGVNMNFAPVADVDSNPRNPIIGTRSFSSDPAVAARLVAASVRGYRAAGLVSCAKHFPGHGDTAGDSHRVLPRVRASRATLFARELVPFRAAIRAGVPAIMTAHVVYPALDSKRPATLSAAVLQKLLRGRLGFKGVVVSDDLEMSAIAGHGEVRQAAVAAIEAGVDLLLVCKSLDRCWEVYEELGRALRGQGVAQRRMGEAFGRIQALKRVCVRPRQGRAPHEVWKKGWPRHRTLARRITELGKQKFFESR
ncbi:MAG: beta-N-acetylhexosaminidase [Pseudomonadota bacterium]